MLKLGCKVQFVVCIHIFQEKLPGARAILCRLVNTRALISYNIDSQQFGPMLIPVILDKLPADIKLKVSRKMNDKDWQIDEIIDILKLEI